MGRDQHAAAAVDAILYDDEVVVAGELMLIYAVQTPLLGRATKAIAVRQQACKLQASVS
jgi:hypothetical protein